jgi:hypothetical protein
MSSCGVSAASHEGRPGGAVARHERQPWLRQSAIAQPSRPMGEQDDRDDGPGERQPADDIGPTSLDDAYHLRIPRRIRARLWPGRKPARRLANTAFQMRHAVCAARTARRAGTRLTPLKRGAESCRGGRSARLERTPGFGSRLLLDARPGRLERPLPCQREGGRQNRRMRVLLGRAIRRSGERARFGAERWDLTREAERPEGRSAVRHQRRQQRTQRFAGQIMTDLRRAMQHEQQSKQPRRPSEARAAPCRPALPVAAIHRRYLLFHAAFC